MSRSRGSVVLFVLTFFFTFLQDASSLPTLVSRQQEQGFDFSRYTVPLSDGPSTLPPPPQPLTLKAITLARGHQNYTCSHTSPPTLYGALATLYDATPLLALLAASQPPSSQPQAVLDFFTRYLYYAAFPAFLSPPDSDSSDSSSRHGYGYGHGHEDGHEYGREDGHEHEDEHENEHENEHEHENENNNKHENQRKHAKDPAPYPDAAPHTLTFPILGHHFFDGAHVPTWDMGPRLGVLRGKKVAGIKGVGEGSVDWLVLDGIGGGGGYGDGGGGVLKEVYRVETVGGGVGGACEGRREGEVVRVGYAAQYWFYG